MSLKEKLLIRYNSFSKAKKTSFYKSLTTEELKEIDQMFPLLNNHNLKTKIKWLFTDRVSFPICPVCKKEFGQEKDFKRLDDEYPECCCRKCLCKQIAKRNLEKYGVKNVSQLAEIKNKKKETMISNFGSLENAYKERNEKTKKTIKKKPNFFKEISEKAEKTCLEKYGVKNVSQLAEIKNKKKETMISNFGSLENAYKERNEKTKKTIAKTVP